MRTNPRRKVPVRDGADSRSGVLHAGSPNPNNPLGSKLRRSIISAYGQALERCSSPIESETSLPFSKSVIRKAIYEELEENPDIGLRNHLEVAFVQLESFLPTEEYELVTAFKMAGARAQEMAKSGNPNDIVESARILKQVEGDAAVQVLERISTEMRKRLEEIQAFGMPFLSGYSQSFSCSAG